VYSADAVVATYFTATGYKLRVVPDESGGHWIKCAIATRSWPRHYLLVYTAQHCGFTAGLVQLAEKIEEFHAGNLKPSPDKWNG
jgi:hypothetical protein